MAKLARELKMGIHNCYEIEVVDVNTGKVKEKARAFNVVCNGYYTTMFNHRIANDIRIGKGSGTPAATDTALFSAIGSASSDSTYSPSDTYDISREHEGIWKRTLKRAIPNTQYVGETITEIGLFDTSGVMVSHAMLQDMNGNPISITHTSTDVIYVYCTLYLHYDGQHSDIRLYYNPQVYQGGYGNTIYAGEVCGDLLQSPWYPEQNAGNVGRSSYLVFEAGGYYDWSFGETSNYTAVTESIDSVNKRKTYTATQLPVSKGNLNGINKIGLTGGANNSDGGKRHYIAAAVIDVGGSTIPSSHVTGESVGVGDGATTKFKTKFHEPYNATVYVNGVAQSSGVTIKKKPVVAIAHTNGVAMGPINNFNWISSKDANDINFEIPRWRTSYGGLKAGEIIEIRFPDIGIYAIQATNGKVKASNDGVTWVDVTTTMASTQMADADAHYKYYKLVEAEKHSYVYLNDYDGYNIVFDTPPANGDVITIDYTTDFITKDSDHVIDMTFTFTYGEWTGE